MRMRREEERSQELEASSQKKWHISTPVSDRGRTAIPALPGVRR